MKKRWHIYILIIIIISIPKFTYAENTLNIESTNSINTQNTDKNEISTESIIKEQESKFGIKDFLKETEKYVPEYFKDLNISKIFKEATTGKINNEGIWNKILPMLGKEITNTLKVLINILVIVLIHSLLKSITDSLESTNVSKIVYYVQYILIVTVIMASFSDIIRNITETIQDLVGFSEVLVPLLITLMMFTRQYCNNYSYRTNIVIFNTIYWKFNSKSCSANCLYNSSINNSFKNNRQGSSK